MFLLFIGVLLLLIAVIVRKNTIAYIAQISFLWLVASNNTFNPDYINYLNGYEHMYGYQGLISEPFYWMLARIAKTIGFSFQEYRYLFFAIAFIILGLGIWKISNFPNIVLGLYFLYPFCLDVIQMRTLMANALIIIAIWKNVDFLDRKRKTDIVISACVFILAIGFHFSSVAAIVIYLALVSKQTFLKCLPWLLLVGVLIVLVLILFRGSFIGKLNALGILQKMQGYQAHNMKVGGYLISVFVLRVMFFLVCWFSIHAPEQNNSQLNGNRHLDYYMRSIALLSVYVFLEMLVSMEFERLSRIALLLGYSLILLRFKQVRKADYRIIISSLIFFVFAYCYIMYFKHFADSATWFEYAVIPIFQENRLAF